MGRILNNIGLLVVILIFFSVFLRGAHGKSVDEILAEMESAYTTAYITAINQQQVNVPWLENRRLNIEVEVPGNSRNK